MVSDTFSNTLGFLEMATGNDNSTWGSNANASVFQVFEDAIANFLTTAVTGGTLDLSGSPPPNAPSQVRFAALVFTGVLTTTQTIKVPNLDKFWWVQNSTSGAFVLNIQTPSGATTTIPQNGGWQLVICDGNNHISASPFNSAQIQMPDGSVNAPAYSDINETNSGLYRHGTNDWRFAIGGVDILQITGAGGSPASSVNSLVPLLNQGQALAVIPSGAEFPFAGISAPAGFFLENGQTVSRTSFPNLLAALRVSFTCTFVSGSAILSSVSVNLTGLGLVGAVVECGTSGITGDTITAITSNSITLNANASGNSSGTVTVFAYPYGNGDGSTTFTLPDRRGRVLAGRDDMGGTAAGRMTATTLDGTKLSSAGGSQTGTIAQANLPNVNFTISGITLNDPQHTHVLNNASNVICTNGNGANVSGGGGSYGQSASLTIALASTGITISNQGHAASGGSGTAISLLQPVGITNYIIKT
jgi:microcystin-dependent protein